MTVSNLRQTLTDALFQARQAADLLDAAMAANTRAQRTLERALEGTLQRGVEAPVEDLPPATEHRRQHRPGRQSRIESDPELRAFIEARLDRCTFHQIAAAVAEHFPPERRVAKTSIGDYSKRQRTRRR